MQMSSGTAESMIHHHQDFRLLPPTLRRDWDTEHDWLHSWNNGSRHCQPVVTVPFSLSCLLPDCCLSLEKHLLYNWRIWHSEESRRASQVLQAPKSNKKPAVFVRKETSLGQARPSISSVKIADRNIKQLSAFRLKHQQGRRIELC